MQSVLSSMVVVRVEMLGGVQASERDRSVNLDVPNYFTTHPLLEPVRQLNADWRINGPQFNQTVWILLFQFIPIHQFRK